jgi:hypothetical protein
MVFFTLNEAIIVEIFHCVDIGGSMVIHAFGGLFGVAASFFF